MAGIVGIEGDKREDIVNMMLYKISHRGRTGKEVFGSNGFTLGIVWNASEWESVLVYLQNGNLIDGGNQYRQTLAKFENNKLLLSRDALGIAPLYYGHNSSGHLCFASEVKALKSLTSYIYELKPGHTFEGTIQQKNYDLKLRTPVGDSPETIAAELYNRLEKSITNSIKFDSIGSWLSGGLDSSTISAIARKHLNKLHTFVAGVKGAPDFEYAAIVAKHIQSEHHEIVVSLQEMIDVLPDVIYHLESFDALLIRSTIINYLASKKVANYIHEVFSGEVGDELFAGYSYLKSIPANKLDEELIDITSRLHNTALQRVDRSSAAFGIIPHVPFADPNVFEYALTIPVKYKLNNGIEKWILRKAIEKDLPEKVLNRPKAKFWEGGGVGDLLADYASKMISDNDFKQECILFNGWDLNSKEELMYYRIFKQHFGDLENLDWMGRTKK